MAEPTTATAGAAGIAVKFGALLGAGVLGAVIMAAFDPPRTRREVFLQGCVAGVGGTTFGPITLRLLATQSSVFAVTPSMSVLDYLEIALPVCVVVGALSWGAFGALAKLRQIIRERAAQAVADKTIGPEK